MKLVLALTWQLMRFHVIAFLSSMSEKQGSHSVHALTTERVHSCHWPLVLCAVTVWYRSEKQLTEKDVLDWANTKVTANVFTLALTFGTLDCILKCGRPTTAYRPQRSGQVGALLGI